jgi:hypothetical protein
MPYERQDVGRHKPATVAARSIVASTVASGLSSCIDKAGPKGGAVVDEAPARRRRGGVAPRRDRVVVRVRNRNCVGTAQRQAADCAALVREGHGLPRGKGVPHAMNGHDRRAGGGRQRVVQHPRRMHWSDVVLRPVGLKKQPRRRAPGKVPSPGAVGPSMAAPRYPRERG